jgi:hypothetical protein
MNMRPALRRNDAEDFKRKGAKPQGRKGFVMPCMAGTVQLLGLGAAMPGPDTMSGFTWRLCVNSRLHGLGLRQGRAAQTVRRGEVRASSRRLLQAQGAGAGVTAMARPGEERAWVHESGSVKLRQAWSSPGIFEKANRTCNPGRRPGCGVGDSGLAARCELGQLALRGKLTFNEIQSSSMLFNEVQ